MERKQARSGVWGATAGSLEHAGGEDISVRGQEDATGGVMHHHQYYRFQNEICLSSQILPDALGTLTSKFKFHFNSSHVI